MSEEAATSTSDDEIETGVPVAERNGDYQEFRVWPERLNIFTPSLG